jgi:nucleoid-associated protein YgaU
LTETKTENIAPHASPSFVSINLANLELIRKLGRKGHTFKQRLKKPQKETIQQELEGEQQVLVPKKVVRRQSRKKKSRSSLKEERKLERRSSIRGSKKGGKKKKKKVEEESGELEW